LGLEWAGFHAVIPKEEIEDGAYKIGIYVKKGDIEALKYTDIVVIKSEHGAELQS